MSTLLLSRTQFSALLTTGLLDVFLCSSEETSLLISRTSDRRSLVVQLRFSLCNYRNSRSLLDILYRYIYIYIYPFRGTFLYQRTQHFSIEILAELRPLLKSLKTSVVRVVEKFLMEVQYFSHKGKSERAIVREFCLRKRLMLENCLCLV